jgi:peptidoglycan/xylan/chitin deacetylase (PgdA/CDA1 family)
MTSTALAGSGKLVAALGYHDVTEVPQDSGFQRDGARPYKLRTAQFSQHLDQIAAGPISPALVTSIDLSRPGRHLLLTFDDGGKSALWIGDELARRGWRGHFFISTGLIGRRTFLTAAEILQLRREGHLIGSHSHNHPDIYRELHWEQMVVEWRQSTDILAQILGEPCTSAAVPGGDISGAVLRSAAAGGLRYLFTSEPSPKPRIVHGTWVLGRFCAKTSTTAKEVGELIQFRRWRHKLLIRQFKQGLGRSVPSLYRLYVGRTTREWQRSQA